YAGRTYEPAAPGEKFEADGLDIAYAAAPGATYGRTATARAAPFRGIVFHHTATPDSSSAEAAVSYGQRYDSVRKGTFGYHFYIDRDGNIIQGAPMSARTSHVRDPGADVR